MPCTSVMRQLIMGAAGFWVRRRRLQIAMGGFRRPRFQSPSLQGGIGPSKASMESRSTVQVNGF
jgi:hypothetical protein